MSGTISRAVGPSNCALAFAVPLTKSDFQRDLEPGSGKDFVQSFAGTKADILPEVLWESFYEPQVAIALHVANEVEQLGVKVSFDLKLAELKALLNSAEVVMLVAHWRSAGFKVCDLVNLPSLVANLLESNNSIAAALRARFSPALREKLSAFNHYEPRPVRFEPMLIEELNRSLIDLELYQKDDSGGGAVLPDTLERRMYLNRLALEEAFPNEFSPGNRLELYDGLHSIATIVDRIPAEYAGILDLTTCNSILLGEGIKRLRRNCLVMVNQKPARLDFRLVLYENVIRELARRNAPYIDVTMRLRKQLLES